jgi:hypothetical protein
MRRLPTSVVLAVSIVLFISGCGGGSEPTPVVSAPAPTANVNVTVNWAARTRDVDALASALSAVFTLKAADPTGSDFSFTVNRDSAPAAYKKSYSSPRLAKLGTWDLAARFYAQPEGQGSVVGKIDAQINLTADGKGIGDFATTGAVASVAVAPNQTIPVGTPTDILFVAKDAGGADLALTPGAAKFQVVYGGDVLSINAQGQAVGAKPGTAPVNVTVDGKTSPDQQVTVGYQTAVTLTPATATIFANGQVGFDVKVDGVPAQQTNVAWSVQEGDSAGFVSSGSYVAPSAPGTYHVVAASSYDATKRGVATVTVTGPAAPNQPGIYVFDGARVVHANDITGAGWSGSAVPANSIAVGSDGKLYFAAGQSVRRVDDLSGSNPVSLGSGGQGALHFSNVDGIAVGADGKIYVADSGTNRIIRFDDMAGSNWTELNTGTIGQNPPRSLFVSADNRIYCLPPSGQVYRIDNMQGDGAVDLSLVARSVFVTADGHIYGVHGWTITRMDDVTGKNTITFGSTQGSGTGQFSILTSIWVTSNGQIYVADAGNQRVVRIDDMAGKNWTALGGKPGFAAGEFQSPSQVIVK